MCVSEVFIFSIFKSGSGDWVSCKGCLPTYELIKIVTTQVMEGSTIQGTSQCLNNFQVGVYLNLRQRDIIVGCQRLIKGTSVIMFILT